MHKSKFIKKIVLGIIMIGVSGLMFGCGSKGKVNPLGDNLTWSYSKIGKTLTISGEGDMPEDAWEAFKELKINTLVIEEGVTSISRSAFYFHPEIKGNLVIPESVQVIEDFAFYECSGLSGDLIIPEGVTKISDYAFRGCSGFDGKLVIPSTVTSIGEESFYNTAFTGELVLPDSLEYIGRCAFYQNHGFRGDLIIPDGVSHIGDYAFGYCSGFDGCLSLPANMTEIINDTFCFCTNLTGDLVIPESVTSIGANAFRGDGFDGNLLLDENLTEIGAYAFSECKFTGKLVIPHSVTNISDNTFDSCQGIEELILPDGVQTISSYAFNSCSSLSNVNFPSSLMIIGDMAFASTALAGELVFDDKLTSIGEWSFDGCKEITSVILPDSLLNIKNGAFDGCEKLAGNLIIPDNVTYIGEKAFHNCGNIETVTLGSCIESINHSAFVKCPKLTKVVLTGSTPDYYSAEETDPSFDPQIRLEGFDENKKASLFWTSYKEDKLTELASKDSGSGDEKSQPYYWTDGIEGELFKGTGSFADLSIYLEDGEITLSINSREYIKTSYEADPNADYDNQMIQAEGLVCKAGVLTELHFHSGGYMKNVIQATLVWEDGIEDYVYFTNGSEESVLPFGYECTDESYLEEDYIEGEDDIDGMEEPDASENMISTSHALITEEDFDKGETVWFGDEDKLADGCSVYCAVEDEKISVSASSTLKSSGSNSYDASNIIVQNISAAWVEGKADSGIGETITITRTIEVNDKAYGIDYTEVCVVNGYAKDKTTWLNNNRVKTLKFYFNGKYVCDLNLDDTIIPQYFDLSAYKIHADSGEEVTFMYEIVDVYPGEKYDDTALTGIIVDFYTPNH